VACISHVSGFKADEVHWRVVDGKLPEDVRVVGMDFDAVRGCLLVVIESDSFESMYECAVIPFQPLPRHKMIVEDVSIE